MERIVQVTKSEARAFFSRAELLIKEAKSISDAVNARMATARARVYAQRRHSASDRRRGDRRVRGDGFYGAGR